MFETPHKEWLGDAYDALSNVAIEAFTEAVNTYKQQPHQARRDPESPADHAKEDDAAMTAILQSILHEDSLNNAAQRVRDAEEALTAWIRAESALGTPETVIAEKAGIARDTVRKRLGK